MEHDLMLKNIFGTCGLFRRNLCGTETGTRMGHYIMSNFHIATYVGTGPGPEWITVFYVKPSHCNLCGNLNGSYTLALYQSRPGHVPT